MRMSMAMRARRRMIFLRWIKAASARRHCSHHDGGTKSATCPPAQAPANVGRWFTWLSPRVPRDDAEPFTSAPVTFDTPSTSARFVVPGVPPSTVRNVVMTLAIGTLGP